MASQSREKQADPNAGAKTQARRRLIGAGVVCAATAGLLFSVLEREPKPASPDVVLKGSQQSAPLSPPISPPAASAPDVPKVEPKSEPATEPTAVARPPLVVAPLPKADVAPQDPIAKLAEEKAKPAPAKQEAKPEPKKPEPKKDEPKKEDSKGYSVQIGAFSSKDAAQNALAKIKGLKLIGYTETVSTPAGERTRVRAGPYKDKEGAQSALNKLKAAGIDAALVAP